MNLTNMMNYVMNAIKRHQKEQNTIIMLEENKNTRRIGKNMGKMKTIAMMYEDGYSIEEIAEAVNTKPSTIYALLHKRTDTYGRR